jgi:prepilin peptidase CpaA
MHAPLWVALPVILLVALATRADVRKRKIPNVLTGPALLLGVLVNLGLGGVSGAGSALLGAVVAGAVLFPGWIMGFTAAGDLKLMAAVGAWLGYPGGFVAAVAALIAGGVIAVIVAAAQGALWRAVKSAARLGFSLLGRTAGAGTMSPTTSGMRFPFAPAVFAGTIFALLYRG